MHGQSIDSVSIVQVHEKQRPHVCEHCGRSFAARAGMDNHIQLIHQKQTPFACDRLIHCFFGGKNGLIELFLNPLNKLIKCRSIF